jgi:hypothetical protein
MKSWYALALAAASSHAAAAVYYVAPQGNDSAPGTLAAPWKTIAKAQAAAAPGDTIWFRGGEYIYTAGLNTCSSRTATVNAVTLDKSGQDGAPIRYWAYPGEKPKFDFSRMKDDCRVKGFNITGSWLHLKGLEISGAPQQPGNLLNNESWGVWNRGSRNIFEALDIHHHMGPGLFISRGSHNLVLNTDSHHNYDPYSKSGAGQNADGFGAHIAANEPGNIFRGCRAWANTDDGFDTINAGSPVVIERSWAWSHGYLPGTTTSLPAGNGNGFKIGGFGGDWEANAPVHVTRLNVAFNNKPSVFYANHHPVAIEFFNNTSINNRYGFNFLGVAPDGSDINLAVARNNVAFGRTLATAFAGTDSSSNSWDIPVAVSAADFQSLSTEGWDAPRLPDGSLPDLPHFRLAAGSVLVDAGVDIGLPFDGAAPDLGAYEGTAPVARRQDVTGSVRIVQTGLVFDRATQQQRGTVTFTNTGGTAIAGTLYLRLDYLSDGVVLHNESGAEGGAPVLALPVSSLAPGETSTVTTIFLNPQRVSIGYTPKLFAANL